MSSCYTDLILSPYGWRATLALQTSCRGVAYPRGTAGTCEQTAELASCWSGAAERRQGTNSGWLKPRQPNIGTVHSGEDGSKRSWPRAHHDGRSCSVPRVRCREQLSLGNRKPSNPPLRTRAPAASNELCGLMTEKHCGYNWPWRWSGTGNKTHAGSNSNWLSFVMLQDGMRGMKEEGGGFVLPGPEMRIKLQCGRQRAGGGNLWF